MSIKQNIKEKGGKNTRWMDPGPSKKKKSPTERTIRGI
jgi:hypothetical protein